MQAAIAREGRIQDFPVLDTQSLNWVPYHRFIHKRYPDKIPLILSESDTNLVHPLKNFGMIASLAKTNTICYLHPSYGYYFEQFFQEPHGMAYPLKSIPETTILPTPLETNLIAENELFWDRSWTPWMHRSKRLSPLRNRLPCALLPVGC